MKSVKCPRCKLELESPAGREAHFDEKDCLEHLLREYAKLQATNELLRCVRSNQIVDYEQVLLTCGMLPRAKEFHKQQEEMRERERTAKEGPDS